MHASWNYQLFEKIPRGPAKDVVFWSDQSVPTKFLPGSLSEKARCVYGTDSDILAG